VIRVQDVSTPGAVRVRIGGVDQGLFQPGTRIVVYGLAGDDEITIGGQVHYVAWLYGGDGNDVLDGGPEADVLLGEAGDDELRGNGDRDILIGGDGADSLYGGDGDDLLIAGGVRLTNLEGALGSIAAEWNATYSSNSLTDYQLRRAHLRGAAGGVNGSVFLTAETLTPDHNHDSLAGRAGRDWFLLNTSTVDGLDPVLDSVIDRVSAEFADDSES